VAVRRAQAWLGTLALRGVRCLLVEKQDINAGASGGNHGLLHSGARYIASDPSSARECRDEGAILKRLAPQCVEDTGGLFVAVKGDDEKYIADFVDRCRRCGIDAISVDPKDALEMEPSLSADTIAAFAVEDASIDPFKLSLDNLAQAGNWEPHCCCITKWWGLSNVTAVLRRCG
jgi:glycerol-3-phosphate dehydrogenase